MHVSGDCVVFYAADPGMIRRFNVPHCNCAVLFLGQGTSISQEAMQRLSEEGVLVVFSGTGGTPLLMGSLNTYQATPHFRRMLRVYDSNEASLEAAKKIMAVRISRMRARSAVLSDSNVADLVGVCAVFEKRLTSCANHPMLLSAEGDFAKGVYGAFCRDAGVSGFSRKPGTDSQSNEVGAINRLIDYGNYLAYGIAAAAIFVLGIHPHMSVLHGKTRPGGLVFDIADAWKDSVVIPNAVKFATMGDEGTFRMAVLKQIEDEKLLALSIDVVEQSICAGEKVLGGEGEGGRFQLS